MIRILLFVFSAMLLVCPVRANPLDFGLPKNECGKTLNLPSRAEMENALRDYLFLSEEALSMRATAIRLYYELEEKKRRGPLNGQDLMRINEGAAALIKQREVLIGVALAHECWIVPPASDKEAADIQRTGVLMSLAAALLLYDNYLSAVSLYRSDDSLRQHLNKPDQGFELGEGELQKADLIFASPTVRSRVRQAIKWYTQHGKAASGFEGYNYLVQSIEQSPSLHLVGQNRPLLVLGHAFELFGNYTSDSLLSLQDKGSRVTSLVFGNTVGLVETRKGKLYAKQEVEKRLRAELRAGDILLEKTPFRLTDSFIPGFWGHAAIWIGTEQELVALGIWDHPLVRPYQEAIRAGRGVVEALRSGVEINDVAHFMNIDDLALLRRTGMGDAERKEVIFQALRQIGKEYDFNFDAQTTDRVYCSKLVYLVYGDIQWPTSRMLGRYTVSPDDIARRSLDGGPLGIVLLYHDGTLVNTPLQPAMVGLLGS